MLLVQGADDQYGTLAQLDAIERGVGGPVERLVIPGVGHAPHLEAPDATVAAVATFINGSEPLGPRLARVQLRRIEVSARRGGERGGPPTGSP